MEIVDKVRRECARVAELATHVRIERDAISAYAAELAPLATRRHVKAVGLGPEVRERAAAFWLTLDAINFGSGWFPKLRKGEHATGYRTIEAGVRRRFAEHGPWSAAELTALSAEQVAEALEQDPEHELMALMAVSLNDLGTQIAAEHEGRFLSVVDRAQRSAVAVVTELARWDCFSDSSTYKGHEVPFLKRAQIAASDLRRPMAGTGAVVIWRDLARLTLFADNLVPHVLRLDGILSFEPELVARIDRGELIEHGSEEEVEIRACALHAVELIAAASSEHVGTPSPQPLAAATLDEILWNRGQGAHYKAAPRHRSRCTAY